MQGEGNNYPQIMGIINLTPDSFFSESRIDSYQKINYLDYQYADILDIGAESSRPGASPVSEKIELSRISHFLNEWKSALEPIETSKKLATLNRLDD